MRCRTPWEGFQTPLVAIIRDFLLRCSGFGPLSAPLASFSNGEDFLRADGSIIVTLREALIKSFDGLRTNGNLLNPFVVSLSNHIQIRLDQRFLRCCR